MKLRAPEEIDASIARLNLHKTEVIDMTPTWSAVGEIYIILAESNEQAALRAMGPEVRRAFAIATAAVAASEHWDESQRAAFDQRCQQELAKHSR